MPVVLDGNSASELGKTNGRPHPITVQGHQKGHGPIRIALVNNMPDAALEDTESQFLDLMRIAGNGMLVELSRYSLPRIPRSERALQYLKTTYLPIEHLLENRFDGAIVTGTEPHHQDLTQEPYWKALVGVLEWAERHTTSTILSCLAAHAGALHGEGIERRRLNDKKFGVFGHAKTRDHFLTRGVAAIMHIPHSRWNDVSQDALISAGYDVLTRSGESGAGLFIKQKADSLFLHFQGHPEYRTNTLLKEYRRDIRRFLNHERETYPSMPQGYFDSATTDCMSKFQDKALSERHEGVLADFPETQAASSLQNTWLASAVCVYRNWLEYLVSANAESGIPQQVKTRKA